MAASSLKVLEALFDSSPAMLAVASLDGATVEVNPAWATCLSPAGASLLDLVVPEDREDVASRLASLSDGESASGSARFGDAGVLRWNVARSGADLLVTAVRAQEAAELAAVASAVSHDLRAPLRAIDGFTRMVLRDEAEAMSDTGRRFLGLVADAVADLAGQVDGLVAAARLASEPVRREEVDVAAVVAALGRESSGELPACSADPRLVEAAFAAMGPGPFSFDAAEGAYVAPWTGTVPFVVARAALRHGGRAWTDGSVLRVRFAPG